MCVCVCIVLSYPLPHTWQRLERGGDIGWRGGGVARLPNVTTRHLSLFSDANIHWRIYIQTG